MPLHYNNNIEENKDTDNKFGTGNEDSRIGSGSLGLVSANTYQAATLNKLLPRGFRIELEEIVQRNV